MSIVRIISDVLLDDIAEIVMDYYSDEWRAKWRDVIRDINLAIGDINPHINPHTTISRVMNWPIWWSTTTLVVNAWFKYGCQNIFSMEDPRRRPIQWVNPYNDANFVRKVTVVRGVSSLCYDFTKPIYAVPPL
jgi:hypothetical protein